MPWSKDLIINNEITKYRMKLNVSQVKATIYGKMYISTINNIKKVDH